MRACAVRVAGGGGETSRQRAGWLGYSEAMDSHSVADESSRLTELVDRVLAGENVVVTRGGRPVVALRAVPLQGRRMTSADLDWLDARRAGLAAPAEDAGALVSRMRDEGGALQGLTYRQT